MENLYFEIRNKAILQYCYAFTSLDLNKMSTLFMCNVAELETQIAHLITSNQLNARIDSHQKILKFTNVNLREKVYKDTLESARDFRLEAELLAIRAQLNQAGMTIQG